MKGNEFFKPTPLYKEYMILDLISKDEDITQRTIGNKLKISVSMVNEYLTSYERRGYLIREHLTTKTVKYRLTDKGLEKRKVLNIGYYKSAQAVHLSARQNIVELLEDIVEKGYHKIILYGAGEVGEMLLQVIKIDSNLPILVPVVIDDDPGRQNNKMFDVPIVSSDKLWSVDHDGVIVASYNHNSEIYDKLLKMNYPQDKIIKVFG